MAEPSHKTLADRTVLNEGTEEEIECYGYKQSAGKTILVYLGVFFTGGLLLLLWYWKPEWSLRAQNNRCPLKDAEAVLIKDIFRRWHTAKVLRENVELPDDASFQRRKLLRNKSPSDTSTEPLDDARDKERMVSGTKIQANADMADDTNMNSADIVDDNNKLCYFKYQKIKYLWDPYVQDFYKLRGLDECTACGDFFTKYTGFSVEEQEKRRQLYGRNKIEVRLRSIAYLFVTEALNPFYVFQLYSVLLWIIGYNYIYFSVAIILMSVTFISVTVYNTRKQSVTLRKMVESKTKMTVYRGNGVSDEVLEDELVPGDVIVLPAKGCLMTCDAVLTSGSCIVNESMLTGESVPVTKTPIQNIGTAADEIYNQEGHKRNTLFCGTDVIQCRKVGKEDVKAVVIRTGFITAKGTLVRTILFPKPMDFKLYRDALRFIGVLAIIAAIGFVYIITIKVLHDATIQDIVIKGLDIFTIAVPPALPAALTIGMVYAQGRLKKLGIYCISPQRINVSGTLDVVCFDKTGTLTEDHLELLGVAPISGDGKPSAMPVKLNNGKETESFELVEDPSKLPDGPVLHCMATCHSLTIIEGELRGDPLDLQMFDALKWHLKEPEDGDVTGFDNYMPTIVRSAPWPEQMTEDEVDGHQPSPQQSSAEIGILRQFTFSSALQRMSVITQTNGAGNMQIFVKGAPEKVASLCDNATVPDDFYDVLHEYTHQGLRVLAIAFRNLPGDISYNDIKKITRDEVENNLTFLGLLIMQNTIKSETIPAIKKLKKAKIRTVMVTGDNILTAIHVARKCAMIEQKEMVLRVEAHPPTLDTDAHIQYTIVGQEMHGRAFSKSNGSQDSKDTNENSALVDNVEDPESVKITIDSNVLDRRDHSTYHLAMDGKTFAVILEHFPELVPKIALKGTVFARMAPDQKAQLVEALQSLQYYVGMCGDGANDCGALKTAHAGVSLSEAEASVASPFTSKTANIECIPTLVREGRAALVTSFGVFKYMAMYSMIQFISVMILNTIQSFPGDWMFMYWDIAITTVVALLCGRNEAYPKIVAKKPQTQLMEAPMIFSIICMILLQLIFQVAGFFVLTSRPWFSPVVPIKGDMNILCYESTMIFYVAAFQYIIVAFLFSKGPPFRKPLYTNIPYTIGLVVLTGITIYLVIYPGEKVREFFMLMEIPEMLFRVVILAIALANFLAALIVEVYIANSILVKDFLTCKRCRGVQTLPKHMQLQKELAEDAHWPHITFKDASTEKPGPVRRAISNTGRNLESSL